MTYEEMCVEFSRLNAMGAPKTAVEREQRERFAGECYRLYAWMTPQHWKQAVSLVIERHKRGVYTIEEFRGAIQSLRERGVVKSEGCRSCGGTKWHYVRLKLESDEIVDAVRPCSSCRPGMVWEPPPNTVSYPADESWSVRMARSMSSKAAYQVLERGNSMGIRFEQDAVAIMTEKAAQYEEEIETRRESQKKSLGLAHPLGMDTGVVVGQIAQSVSEGSRGPSGITTRNEDTPSTSEDELSPFI